MDSVSCECKLYLEMEAGDTILFDGKDSFYDYMGFRFETGLKCPEFYKVEHSDVNHPYIDYVEEPWILHANETRNQFKELLIEEAFHPYVIDNVERLSFLAGLHDIGKLDVLWNEKFAGYKGVPLAHFPFKKGVHPAMFKERNHAVVGAIALTPFYKDPEIELNLVLQHHKRYFVSADTLYVKEYEFVPEAKEVLNEYANTHGWNLEYNNKGKHKEIVYETDVITPKNERWALFVYLVGRLMKAERKAIETVRNRILSMSCSSL